MTTPSDLVSGQPLSRRKRGLFALLALLVVMSPLIGLEWYVRATRPYLDLRVLTGRTTGPNPVRSWAVADAFAAYRGRPGAYPADKTINNYGFVSTPELEMHKPAGVIRILFLGESSTAGMGRDLADEVTWPWQTWELLRQQFPHKRIEFINAALGGYTSFESFGVLWSRARFFTPDIVVVAHGWNEMYYFDSAAKAPAWRTLADGSWTLDRTDQPVAVYEPQAIDALIWPSQTLSYLRIRGAKRLDWELGLPKEIAPDYDHQSLEVWRTNLRLLSAGAEVMGAQLFVIKQPTLITADLAPELRERVSYNYHGFDYDAHVDAYRQIYAVIDQEIAHEYIIDLTSLNGQADLFYDQVHPTPEGSAAIAERVAAALASTVDALPLSPP